MSGMLVEEQFRTPCVRDRQILFVVTLSPHYDCWMKDDLANQDTSGAFERKREK